MKISYFHILQNLVEQPSIDEISQKLIQLGHENTYQDNILDIEFTPNRGDALSLKGISRDLSVFFEIKRDKDVYEEPIEKLNINFTNKDESACPNISFLEIELDERPNSKYKDYLERYFVDLGNKKNNFFTDISNYLLYELGQPTHCYDMKKMKSNITFKKLKVPRDFEALNGKVLSLQDGDYVFSSEDELINLAGIMGGKRFSCSKSTTKVLVECAYFEPDSILGKSTKYNLHSEASYRFERGCDIDIHNEALRRFIRIVLDHTEIINLKIKTFDTGLRKNTVIPFNSSKISEILGVDIPKCELTLILEKFGFRVNSDVTVPSFRSDVESLNDLAEEVARAFGYDNIDRKQFEIKDLNSENLILQENLASREERKEYIRYNLVKSGFTEVINFPFTQNKESYSFKLDNPLDSNKPFLRTCLRESLVNNLLYNERRQRDSIKLFELTEVYTKDSNNELQSKTALALIASGRMGKNYKEFTKKISKDTLKGSLCEIFNEKDFNIEEINRSDLDTKKKDKIFFMEILLDDLKNLEKKEKLSDDNLDMDFKTFEPISDFPLINRDLSLLLKKQTSLDALNECINSIDIPILKETFIFDFYYNEKDSFLKIGYRFVFQSIEKTLQDKEVDKAMSNIVRSVLNIGEIEIPGYEE